MVDNITCEAGGSSKKLSKHNAAQKMIDELFGTAMNTKTETKPGVKQPAMATVHVDCTDKTKLNSAEALKVVQKF